MSASQEKKTRVAQRSEGTDKKRNAAGEDARKAQAFRRNTIIVVVCIVLIVIAAAIINSNLLYRNTTAVTIGSTKYSPAEVNVFYRNTFNSIYSDLGDYASYFVDTSTPLTQQQYFGNTDQTWADYLYEETLDNMREITALYDAAIQGGYTLTEEDNTSLDGQVSSIELYASMYGYGSPDKYLTAYYGKGVNQKIFRSVMEQNWSTQYSEGLTYDQAALNAYYAEHQDELDVISYYSYTVNASGEAFESLADADAQLAAAVETANGFAEATDAADFAARVEQFSGSAPSENHYSGDTVTSYSESAAEWLLDRARQSGDTTVVETDTGATVFYFTGRDDNDYKLANMRHILIMADADEDGEVTDEERDAAEAEIARIAGEWESDPTEDHFAELANQYSEDTGSNTNGGLYENVYHNQMVSGIDSFLFYENAQPGDTKQIYNDGSYTGSHLVYYIGESEDTYRNELAETALRSADYSAYIESLTSGYTVTEGSGSSYVNKD